MRRVQIVRGGADPAAIAFDGDLDALHLALVCRGGQFDVIDDDAGGPGIAGRFRVLVFHVRPGGQLTMRLPVRGPGREKLLGLLDDVRALQAGGEVWVPPLWEGDARPLAERDLHTLAASVREVRVADDVVSLRVHAETLAKVRDGQMNEVLAARPEWGRVVGKVDAVEYPSRGSVQAAGKRDQFPAHWVAPELSVREYHHPLVKPRQVVWRDDVVLPESFRSPHRPRLTHRWLREWSKYATHVPDRPADREENEPVDLPGAYFYFDNIMRGHFGHAVTEQLSLVWAWQEARQRHPGLRALVGQWDTPPADWEYELWQAAGIGRDDVVVAEHPVRPELLVASTPGYVIGSYIHPVMEAVYADVGARLEAAASPGPRPERLFLTRRSTKRACGNRADVEAVFAEAGFAIVAPEEHPLAEQVAMVRAARVVAGFAGSAMFHLLFAQHRTRVGVLGSQGYPAANERAICAAFGHELALWRGASDVVTEGFSLESFHSDFVIDLADPTLRAWLADGGPLHR